MLNFLTIGSADALSIETAVGSHCAEANPERIVGFHTVLTRRADRRCFLILVSRLGLPSCIRHIGRVRRHTGAPVLGRSTTDRVGVEDDMA
ncbi:hypothetical protein A0W34_05945 [Rhodococcus sp. BH4]|nr:hypothetical protein A0W34_05945 [Rhodococcus sp. BH4]